MFLLLGLRPIAAIVLMLTFVCGRCGTTAAQRIVREQQKVTVFFIPLLTIRTSWFVQCDHCGIETSLTRDQAEHAQRWAASHGPRAGLIGGAA